MTKLTGTNDCEFRKHSFLGHVLLGAKIGVVDRGVLVGVVLLASQFGVMEATCVAKCASSIWSTSPLRSFSAVAAVAAARRSSTSPTLLRIRASESRFHVILVVTSRHDRLGIRFLLLTLLRSLLVVSQLLCNDDLTDLG